MLCHQFSPVYVLRSHPIIIRLLDTERTVPGVGSFMDARHHDRTNGLWSPTTAATTATMETVRFLSDWFWVVTAATAAGINHLPGAFVAAQRHHQALCLRDVLL